VLELPAFEESPPYVALIVGIPTPVPVTVTEQAPDDRVQDPLENDTVPVPPDCVQAIVPVGEVPVTVAVQLVVEPAAIEARVQEIETEDAPTVSVVGPELARLLESPPYVAVKVTEPAVEAVIVAEQLPAASVQVFDTKVTLPLPV
jgi:hypothetical protein